MQDRPSSDQDFMASMRASKRRNAGRSSNPDSQMMRRQVVQENGSALDGEDVQWERL